MDDAQRLDWAQDHLANFTHTVRYERPFEMEWIDSGGFGRSVSGTSLRDCIDQASEIQEQT